MRVSFGRFVLDEQSRSLLCDGQPQLVQPLVFDLLVYLLHHRARVVSKEELLTELWAGVNVTDGSLQRAVSLLRSTLREGGSPNAVQTFARRGYRFCETLAADGDVAATSSNTLRALVEAGQWERALSAFATQDAASFTAEDWEAWAEASMCVGQPQQAVVPLERAVAAFEARGAKEAAARVAIQLSNLKLEARELAIAKGWYERARSYLQGEPEGKQHGLVEWIAARLALFDAQLDQCSESAQRALQIGQRVGDPDLQCLGLIYHGHILIACGQTRRGLALHDEAGAAALAGRVSAFVGGIVFCSVIWAYLHLGDHHRASQWTDEFTRWCERHQGYCYPALCRLHRGEVLALRGELRQAEAQILEAREQLATTGPYAEGDAHRVLGEIGLLRGDLASAESAFRESHRLGWNPQPGLALLLAERGQVAPAVRQLEQALAQPGWTDGQRKGTLLAVLARIHTMAGQVEAARNVLDQLAAAPELCTTRACEAERERARGELAWALGERAEAERALRRSVSLWLETNARVHAAHVRVCLSKLLLQIGDSFGAELELKAAESVFREVEAAPMVAHCARLVVGG